MLENDREEGSVLLWVHCILREHSQGMAKGLIRTWLVSRVQNEGLSGVMGEECFVRK